MQLILQSVIGNIYMMARSCGTENVIVINIHKFWKGPVGENSLMKLELLIKISCIYHNI